MSEKNSAEAQVQQTTEALGGTYSIVSLIQTLLGPFAGLVQQNENKLIFGGAKSSRKSKLTGVFFMALAALVYYVVLLRLDGWIWRILLSFLATIFVSVGFFMFRYYYAVILDQDKREIVVETGGRQTRFAIFDDVQHIKNTEMRQRGQYRANKLSIVLKDGREVRLITYKESKVAHDFPTQINRLLWKWIQGHQYLRSDK